MATTATTRSGVAISGLKLAPAVSSPAAAPKAATTTKSTSSGGGGGATTLPAGAQDISGGKGFFVGGNTSPVTAAVKPVAAPVAPGVSAGLGVNIPGVNPTTSPVTTSDPIRSTYDALNASIQKMANSTGQYSTVYNGHTYTDPGALFDAQRQSLADRRNQAISQISADYGNKAAQQAQTQKSETGTQSMGLARIGGFDSASGQAVLTNLQRTHEAEQNTLMQARQSAILQAQQAFEDKDFALAKLQMDEAKAAEALIYNRQQDFIQNTLAIHGSQRQDAQIEYQKARDTKADQQSAMQFAMENGIKSPFYFVGGVGYDTSTGDALSYDEYIKRGGKADFSNGFVIEPGSQEAKKYAWQMAGDYPDAGINPQVDSLSDVQAKIQSSKLYREKFYHPSSGGGASDSATQQALAASYSQALVDSHGGGTTYNPNTYRQLRNEFAAQGGKVAIFDSLHAPGLSPQDRATLGVGKAAGTDATPDGNGLGNGDLAN